MENKLFRHKDKFHFDSYVANYYTNKIHSCKQRGIPFKLTLTQVKNMLRAKRCQYTGVLLSHGRSGQTAQEETNVTIERIDNSKGYEKGNVCAVSFAANQAKAAFDARFGANACNMLAVMNKNIQKRIK